MTRIRHEEETSQSPSQVVRRTAASTNTIEVKELPSEFKPYPKGVSIRYRTYTYDEVDEFNGMNSQDGGNEQSTIERLNFLIKGVEADGMDRNDLTYRDILYIGLLRKLSTFGTQEFSVHIRHEDGSRHTLRFSLEDLYFEELKVPDLPVVVEVGGKEMRFSPLTLGGYAGMSSDLGESGKPNARQVLAAQCVNMPYEEARAVIGNSTGDDMLVLMEVDKLLDHGIKPLDATYKLENGEEVHRSVALNDPRTLIYPFRRQETFDANAIRFGVHGHGRR